MKIVLILLVAVGTFCFGAGHYDVNSENDRILDADGTVSLDIGSELSSGIKSGETPLSISVAVTEDYLVIGARGGFRPAVYYTVHNGRYIAILKESDDDPGRMFWAVHSYENGMIDSVFVDENNNFLALPGDGYLGKEPPKQLKLPSDGIKLATIAPKSSRRVRQSNSIIAPLSVFDVLAKDLNDIHIMFHTLKDVDDIALVLNDDFYGNGRLHELRPLMSAIKGAGFKNICLQTLNDDEKFLAQASREAEYELYRPFGLSLSQKCSFKLFTAQTKEPTEGAKNLMKNKKFTKDIDKVLKDVAGLQTSDKTVLGGRRARDDGSSSGIGDGLAGLLTGGELAGKAKGNIVTPTEQDIEFYAFGGRSLADIMKVLRQRAPGLRHIYIKSLKKRDFQGDVVVKLAIAPNGEVVYAYIDSSTTENDDFDNDIANAVANWRFVNAQSGNTIVTIKLTFLE